MKRHHLILLIITHVMMGVIGVLTGVLLTIAKVRDHDDNQQQADSDEKLADFHTVRVSTGLGSTGMKDRTRPPHV
jgi:hypothetical protein